MSEEKEGKLASKLREQLAKTGGLSSSDMAVFERAQQAQEPPAEAAEAPAESDTELPPADAGKADPLNAQANEPPAAHDALRSEVAGLKPSGAAKIKITTEDKEAFIQAAITGERMRSTYRLLGGKLTVVVRNRTLPESRAVIAQIRHELETNPGMTNLDYTIRLRSMLMAAQIEEIRGVAQPTLTDLPPLRRTQTKDGVTEPGWLGVVEHWSSQNEGLHGLLWQCIWEFETKYWTMVDESKTQDFWSPGASTSE